MEAGMLDDVFGVEVQSSETIHTFDFKGLRKFSVHDKILH